MTETTYALHLTPVEQDALTASLQKMMFNPDTCFAAHNVEQEEVLSLVPRAQEIANIPGGTTWHLTEREVIVLHCAVASGDMYTEHDGYPGLEGNIYSLKIHTGFNGTYPTLPIRLI